MVGPSLKKYLGNHYSISIKACFYFPLLIAVSNVQLFKLCQILRQPVYAPQLNT